MAVLKYKSKDGSYKTLFNYNIKNVDVLQTVEGDSTEATVSQKAIKDALADKADNSSLQEVKETVDKVKEALPSNSSTTNTIVLKEDLDEYLKKTEASVNEGTKTVTIDGNSINVEEIVNEIVYGDKDGATSGDAKVVTTENLAETLEDYALKTYVDNSVSTAKSEIEEEIPTTVAELTDAADYMKNEAFTKTAIEGKLFSSGTVDTVIGIPVTNNLVIASVAATEDFSLASVPPAGTEIYVIVKNTSGSQITISLPSDGTDYVSTSENIEIAGGEYGEISAVSDGTTIYLRGVA